MPANDAAGLALRWTLPAVREEAVSRLVRDRWGLRGTLKPLPSERDLNFRIDTITGDRYVLKVANAAESADVLSLQHAALERVAAADPQLSLPRLVRAANGRELAQLTTDDAQTHWVRMLTWVPGVPLASVRPRTLEQMQSLGAILGRIDSALANWDPPAARRPLKWDLAHAQWIEEHWPCIDVVARRLLARKLYALYTEQVLPHWDRLPASVIQNDANDHNVLVAETPAYVRPVVSVIDFGDMVRTATVAEPAIACAYAMLNTRDPLAAAAAVVRGYHEKRPLSELEVHVLYPLICARLVVSAVNSALQRQITPENEYLQVSDSPVWELLERLDRVHPRFAEYVLRAACGLPAHPAAPGVAAWIESNRRRFVPLIEVDPAMPLPRVDLSLASPLIDALPLATDEPALSRRIDALLEAAQADAAVGEYDEARAVYTADTFRTDGWDGPDWRTVHLGLDLFASPGTPVRAPLAGRVHSLRDNASPLDYGPTVILEHEVDAGSIGGDEAGALRFFTLYGHLDRQSLDQHRSGDEIVAGEILGRIGTADVNGGWSPHLHFQIILDLLDRTGEFPGVARPAERTVWCSLSPAPYTLSAVPYVPSPATPSTYQLRAQRAERLGANVSVSYHRPLHIVRGWMQHLFDADGRRYIDAVNNVAHVGHQHPRVVRAGQRQLAVLDTNTRYLHENILHYADRLAATLPAPLRVCYFVNSGSEANELALRLARAHSGKPGVIVIDGAYHGNTTTLIDISPYKCEGPGGRGLASWVRKLPLPDTYRGLYRGEDAGAGERYAALADAAIRELEAAGAPAGAFIGESLLSCGGQIVLPPGYLEGVYRRVRAAGGVTIADEVQVGFGRVGSRFWGFETQAVVPDIVVMGKPAGNGYPLGVVVTTPEITASFDNGMEYFSTFGGNPVSCAIGLAVLDVIEEEALQANAQATGAHLLEGLRGLVERHACAGDARGLGLFAGLELVRDRANRTPFGEGASYVANRLRDFGILLSTDGPDHNVLKIKPPLCFSPENVDTLIEALDRVLFEDEVRRS
jgi:4-aminobutyrate aminotransferase-like enzyme/Ser/Thr protein kinase RdoA (MazF antagonist)